MQNLDDLYIIFQFVKKLTTPFDKTDAFARGIIDADGQVLRSRSSLSSSEDTAAWSPLDILINNLKRLLSKLPRHESMLFTHAMASFLMREPIDKLQEASALNESELSHLVLGPASDKYMTEAIHLVDYSSEKSSEIGVDQIDKTSFRTDTFAGCRVFEVDSDTFKNCRLGKRRYARYEKYVGSGDVGQAIREYGRSRQSKKGIILVDKITGAMLYLRYPNSFHISF